MRCPTCGFENTAVKDSRYTENGETIRRRRYCQKCKHRFTTFERIQIRELSVIKRSGSKKPFDRNKIYKSIATAVRKRNISEERVLTITDSIVTACENGNLREISSRKIGEMIMEELAKVDQVAYIRFASVYKDFSSSKDFANFIGKIKNN